MHRNGIVELEICHPYEITRYATIKLCDQNVRKEVIRHERCNISYIIRENINIWLLFYIYFNLFSIY